MVQLQIYLNLTDRDYGVVMYENKNDQNLKAFKVDRDKKMWDDILNPIINSDSVWKSHALYLIAEYFYSNNQKIKSKEFFKKIMTLSNINEDIKILTQKRLNRDLRE